MVVEHTDACAQRARGLARRHALRAADAVHLASALELGQSVGRNLEFACSDARLVAAARDEGLRVLGGTE